MPFDLGISTDAGRRIDSGRIETVSPKSSSMTDIPDDIDDIGDEGGIITSSSPPKVRTRTYMTTGPGQNLDARRKKASRLSLKFAARRRRLLLGEAGVAMSVEVDSPKRWMGVLQI